MKVYYSFIIYNGETKTNSDYDSLQRIITRHGFPRLKTGLKILVISSAETITINVLSHSKNGCRSQKMIKSCKFRAKKKHVKQPGINNIILVIWRSKVLILSNILARPFV